uniref:DNA ligase IV n=1 Tax=Oryza glumipatula TaxID=40148 RepID=A0A0D9ZQC0_9ORYZ
MAATVRFGLLVAMFQAMSRDRTAAKKRARLRALLDRAYGPGGRDDYFSALRLVLPGLDRERGSYGLKEAALASVLVDALGIAKDSPDAVRLTNWRRGGGFRNAGNFALVAAEVLQRRQGMTSGGLTIKEVNDALDRLAATENRSEKASILSSLIKKTNALEMKWLLMIILKDLKLGISEKSVFHEFHPDAEDLFNVTCDLRLVCEKLNDRSQRHKRQDIEVGKAVRPQLAMRVNNASSAWKKLHGKQVVAECKFDGDRIQIHKNGEEIHFFSRICTWNVQKCPDVAFDILYAGDTSVIHQSLTERHEILRKVVRPLKGHLEILVPTGGLNIHRPPDEPCWSILAHSLDDVEKFFKDTVDNREEGIILKDLESKWEPGDRSGKWLKLKPDYIHAGADLDVIIIGGYYGSGRRGGEVAQFLVGLAVPSDDNSYPKRFLSFCRVGTGLSDEELDALVTKLKPHFRKNEYPKKPPRFYEVTNHSKERPDVWIESPDKSVIISITSDIRTIKSEVFAAPYSLRFPRIQRLRYDKPWHECLDVQAFVDIVHSSNGTTHRAADDDNDLKNVKNGGSFSMNLNDSVTHCIAAEKKGIKYQAATRQGRIIHYSWILDCCKEKRLLHLQPKYILFLADFARHKFPEEIDSYADYFYWDIDISDLKQIFSNMDRAVVDSNMVHHYKKRYCADERFCFFQGCCVYFYHAPLVNADYNVISDLALKRVKQDLTMHGGQVCSILAPATHLIIVSVLQAYNFDMLYKSLPPAERRYLHDKRLQVVSNKWLEDSVEKQTRLPETTYSLKPDTLEEIEIERSEETVQPCNDKLEENEKADTSHVKHAPRKRGRPSSSASRTAKPAPRPVRRTRARRGNQHAKIDDVEPEESDHGETGLDDQIPDTDNISKMEVDSFDKDQVSARPVRRTRARRGKQHAKVDYGQSEESDPGETGQDDQRLDADYISKMEEDSSDRDQGAHPAVPRVVRRSRAQRGKWLAKIDHETGPGETGQDDKKLNADSISKMEEHAHDKDQEPPPGAQLITLDEQEPKGIKSSTTETPSSPKHERNQTVLRRDTAETTSSATCEKMEQMVDPLHAMLLDMIPSLGQMKTDVGNRVAEAKAETNPPWVGSSTSSYVAPVPQASASSASSSGVPAPHAGSSTQSTGVPAPDPTAGAPKKKKVSYKDVAGALLKDW